MNENVLPNFFFFLFFFSVVFITHNFQRGDPCNIQASLTDWWIRNKLKLSILIYWLTNSMNRRVLWLCLSQLSLLHWSSSSKWTGLMTSLIELKLVQWGKPRKKSHQLWAKKLSLYQTVDNKQPMLTAPTVHCALPFCIELGTVVLSVLPVLERVFGFVVMQRRF